MTQLTLQTEERVASVTPLWAVPPWHHHRGPLNGSFTRGVQPVTLISVPSSRQSPWQRSTVLIEAGLFTTLKQT